MTPAAFASSLLWPPRVLVAGLGGDSGKTLVSLAIIAASRRLGLKVAAFKKGPDYIDSAWLSWASGRPARNLDSYLMGFPGVQDSFARHAASADVAIVEGNRGLYDGVDARGTHSSAELAKALHDAGAAGGERDEGHAHDCGARAWLPAPRSRRSGSPVSF